MAHLSDTTTTQPSLFAIFRNRNFSLLWSGQTMAEFGNGFTTIAASILVFRETGSAMSVGLMLMATSLPGLVFGLIAGVFVDRLDRQRLMVMGQILRTVLILLIPVLLPYGVGWLYVLVMASSIVAQSFDPALASALPDVASDNELAAANAFLSASQTGAMSLGFSVAGLITARFPAEWAFYVNALAFLLSGLAVWLVQLPPLHVEDHTTVAAVVQNLRAGATFLCDSPALRSLCLVTVLMAILFGFHNALLLPFAKRTLGATEFEYGLIEGLSTVGFVLGGLWLARVGDRLREGQWLVISFMSLGLITVTYAQLTSVTLAITLGMFLAFANVPSFIARRLLIQRHTTREVRGRVTSVFFVTRDCMFVVGMCAAGLADVYDIRGLYLVEGLLFAGLGMLVLLLPGLGQSAAEWKRAIRLLQGIAEAPGLGVGRSATLADLERLAACLPVFATLRMPERQRLIVDLRYVEAEPGTVLVRQHESSDAAYFILEGQAVAGCMEDGQERVLGVLNAGDFFGEIAALTGVPRTANVVADAPTLLLKVPASTLRHMTAHPALNRLFLSKMTERMIRTKMLDMPRATGLDQELMQDLRTPGPLQLSGISAATV
jgi:DHA3 family macrolide efflux protein-like MFS transporter